MEATFPYTMTPLPEEVQERLKARFLGFSDGLVDVQGRHIMPPQYANFANEYFNYK